ncbi:MAG: hypothetical protein ACRCZJ_09630 [Erysipelotrichaceae bacterium]
MIVKVLFSDEDMIRLTNMASTNAMSVQDYIRFVSLGIPKPEKFTVEVAVTRALELFGDEVNPWTLPDVYGADWKELESRKTGAFGKRFYNHIMENDTGIVFMGMKNDGSRATYKVEK